MKILYDECKSAIINNKCTECNEFYSCYVCDFIEERYQQGRADMKREIKALAHEDATTGNMIISLSDVEKLKENNNGKLLV
ncbi:MAG: hypothetical protein MJ007_02095 [Paludibacteraceae bacterium]|nr:hypothetical protein [Paludibacteraceae bacterium]